MTTSEQSNGDGGNAGAAGGGASAFLNDTGATGAQTDTGAADTGGAGDSAAPSYADWMMAFSDKPIEDGGPSPRDWVAKAGFKDLDSVVISAREAQRSLRTAIPAEGDAPEKWNSFYEKLGRPAAPDGYEIKAPDGFELNKEFTAGFQQVAFDHGLTGKQAEAVTGWYNNMVMTGLQQEASAVAQQQQALRQEWGGNFRANQEVARRGMDLLGIDNETLDAMGRGMGVDKAIKLMHKLGQMTSEDMLREGGRGGGFTLSADEAQAALDEFNRNSQNADLLRRGDAQAVAKQQRLIAQVAAARDAKKNQAA